MTNLTDVTDTNKPPNIVLSVTQVSENGSAGTLIDTLANIYSDAVETFTFAPVASSSLFAIDGSNLLIANGAVLGYEAVRSQSVVIKFIALDLLDAAWTGAYRYAYCEVLTGIERVDGSA